MQSSTAAAIPINCGQTVPVFYRWYSYGMCLAGSQAATPDDHMYPNNVAAANFCCNVAAERSVCCDRRSNPRNSSPTAVYHQSTVTITITVTTKRTRSQQVEPPVAAAI